MDPHTQGVFRALTKEQEEVVAVAVAAAVVMEVVAAAAAVGFLKCFLPLMPGSFGQDVGFYIEVGPGDIPSTRAPSLRE